MKEVVAVINLIYHSSTNRQLMLFGQASQNYTLYQGAIVTKLPDEKPLKLVGERWEIMVVLHKFSVSSLGMSHLMQGESVCMCEGRG